MKIHDTPLYDEAWQGTEVARDAHWRYLWLWYGFNIRVIVVPARPGLLFGGYEWSWCYSRDGGPEAVVEALAAWDPDTQDEPLGWHKRPGGALRRAPRRDPYNPYNQVRCEHGAYITEQCHTEVCHDMLHLREIHGVQP